MSEQLLTLAKEFLRMKSNPEIFIDEFITKWKQERDNGLSLSDPPQMSAALSSVFCLTDMFSADEARESYELDELKLRLEMEKLLSESGFL